MIPATRTVLIIILLLSVWATQGIAATENPPAADSVEPATSSQPVPPGDAALKERIQQEEQVAASRFSILPHRTNYLLPLTYNTSPNRKVYANAPGGPENLDNLEVKYQISLKSPIWDHIFGDNGTLYVAYTQLAFWQAYNSEASSPFREINFEPEIFLAYRTGYHFHGITSQAVTLGLDHQSNGRSNPLSRSWNRVVANLLFSVGDTYVNLRPWYRIPERANNDDNPDIEDFLGYGELFVLRKVGANSLALMLRNNLQPGRNRGAVQVDWSFPLGKKFKGYVQYFNGYGESLVEYNHASNRLGVGVMLTDWL
jgi:phospholipase A1/A2